jgi:hypothetical protein
MAQSFDIICVAHILEIIQRSIEVGKLATVTVMIEKEAWQLSRLTTAGFAVANAYCVVTQHGSTRFGFMLTDGAQAVAYGIPLPKCVVVAVVFRTLFKTIPDHGLLHQFSCCHLVYDLEVS